jgi:hypothetical protein
MRKDSDISDMRREYLDRRHRLVVVCDDAENSVAKSRADCRVMRRFLGFERKCRQAARITRGGYFGTRGCRMLWAMAPDARASIGVERPFSSFASSRRTAAPRCSNTLTNLFITDKNCLYR